MNAVEFLRAVWPSSGIYCLATYPQKSKKTGQDTMWHHPFDTIEGAARFAEPQRGKTNVYFAVHSFSKYTPKTAGSRAYNDIERSAANAAFVRCFYLDLDVDENDVGKHASQAEALGALIGFTKVISLPKPTLVNSGWACTSTGD